MNTRVPNLYKDTELVRVCRALLNMEQKQFANYLGVTPTLISLWENGHRPFPPARRKMLYKILQDMNREIKWFLAQYVTGQLDKNGKNKKNK
jgi:transcriptional regulator with XRE-family HTH domain